MDKLELLNHFESVLKNIDESLSKDDSNTALKFVHESLLLIKSEKGE